eukprot:1408475-Rhodomonas_salina.2
MCPVSLSHARAHCLSRTFCLPWEKNIKVVGDGDAERAEREREREREREGAKEREKEAKRLEEVTCPPIVRCDVRMLLCDVICAMLSAVPR